MDEVQPIPSEPLPAEEPGASNPPTEPAPKSRKKLFMWLLSAAILPVAWIGITNSRLNSSVNRALAGDSRNVGIVLEAHYANRVQFNILVLDLRSVQGKAPIEILRALFQAAEAVGSRGFETVQFANRGEVVYTMSGSDFRDLGSEFSSGQNPLYLARTLPEKIRRPSGVAAFDHWEGGLLGVFGRQMNDAVQFARTWAGE